MKTKIILLLLLVTTSIYSQNTLSGSVKNSNTNHGVQFANVFFPELEKGTITDANGDFIIKNLPNGKFNIVISIFGFETISQDIVINENDLTINLILIPSVIEMDEVIISTPFHKLQGDNVMKVEQEKVSNLVKLGAPNLSQGITFIPGVESISTGNSIGKPVIRGLSSNRVLVYTQGVRLENQQFGAEHGLGINDAGIESIEVIKGPSTLLYGSDALGGVLYLNPERFANSNTSSTDLNFNYYTNSLGKNTNIGYKQSSDAFKFLIRGSFSEHADYKTKSYRVTNTRFTEKDLKIGIGYQKTNYKTELRYNVISSKLGIPEEIGIQNTNTTALLPYQKLNNHIFSSKSIVFFKESSIKINLGYIYNDRKEFEEHHSHENEEEHEDEEDHQDEEEPLEAALNMKLKTFNYDIKYNLPQTGKFETIIGVQGMNQINSNYGEELLIPDAITNDIGILATSHVHFEKLALQLGARFDNRNINSNLIENENQKLTRSFNSFNGAVGLKSEFTPNIVARLNVASGFRAPNLAELTSYGTHEGSNRFEIGNSKLKNEQNLQTDLVLEYKSKHVEFSINGFYNSINNYIYLSPNGEIIDEDPVFEYLQNNARLYGGELELHLHPHPLDWLHLVSSFSTVTGKLNDDTYLPLIPANKLNNVLRVEFGKKNWIDNSFIFFRINTTFDQNNINIFETVNKGYTLLDTGFGGEFKLFKNDLDFSMSVTNITDKTYINHLSRLKPDNIFNMGTSLNFTLSYKL